MVASVLTHRVETPELDKTDGSTISRDELVERLGAGAGTELFVRLDDAYRQGEEAIVASVRQARQSFSAALAPGHARMVKARRSRSGQSAADEEMVLIGMSDLEAVVKANSNEFSWADVFAPRNDLPTASMPLRLRAGVPGRKFAL